MYIIRVFAVTLRSYDRHRFDDQERKTNSSTMIDQLGALLHVPQSIRAGVHRARRLRNIWAHELDDYPGAMSLDRVRGYVQTYLDRFPKSWP